MLTLCCPVSNFGFVELHYDVVNSIVILKEVSLN